MHGVSTTDGVHPGLREPDVADLAVGDEVGEGADGVFDRGAGVDAVLVVEVDVVSPQTPERAFDSGADVRWAAVEVPGVAGVRDEAELGCEHDLVAAVLDGPADQLLVVVGPVDLGGVEESDAEVECAVDRTDGLGFVGDAVRAGHAHGAEADARDLELPQVGCSHDVPLSAAALARTTVSSFTVNAASPCSARPTLPVCPRVHPLCR